MFILEFPQNIAGLIGFIIHVKILNRPCYKYKDAYVTNVPGKWGAISLSRYIFADDTCYKSNIIKHEYGHSIQSKILLVLYLPVIGLPSLIWNRLFRSYRAEHKKSYYWFYTESWANKLGEYKIHKF